MKDILIWSLEKARKQTFNLVEDLQEAQICLQNYVGENHPAWILGHLLLGDTYLLSLLGVRELSEDFTELLDKYGPGKITTSSPDDYDSKSVLVERLTETVTLRIETLGKMKVEDFARPMPDETLAKTQPTIAHHLQMLVFHEGHHCGQLSSWRKGQNLSATHGIFAS